MSLYDLQGLEASSDNELLHSGGSFGCSYQSHIDTTCNSSVSIACDPL